MQLIETRPFSEDEAETRILLEARKKQISKLTTRLEKVQGFELEKERAESVCIPFTEKLGKNK